MTSEERENNQSAQRITAQYEQALATANERIAGLAREKIALRGALAEIERSRGARLLRLLRGRPNAKPRWDPVTADEASRLAEPVPSPIGTPSFSTAPSDHTPKRNTAYGQNRETLDDLRRRRRSKDRWDAVARDPIQNPASEAFYHANGFCIFRDLVPREEAEKLADRLAEELLPSDEATSGAAHTTFDLAHSHPIGLDLATDERLIGAARTATGERDLRFLRWATYQVNHMSFPWHRDNPCRDFGVGEDWDEDEQPYRISKVILYLKCDRFALGVYPGTHRHKDVDRASVPKDIHAFHELHRSHRSAPTDLSNAPAIVHVAPGDVLVFDQRLLHCGRLVTQDGGAFTREILGDKSFVSLIYGANDDHSWQYHSYFNKEREFDLADPTSADLERLRDQGLLHDRQDENFYHFHPDARKYAWFPSRVP